MIANDREYGIDKQGKNAVYFAYYMNTVSWIKRQLTPLSLIDSRKK